MYDFRVLKKNLKIVLTLFSKSYLRRFSIQNKILFSETLNEIRTQAKSLNNNLFNLGLL